MDSFSSSCLNPQCKYDVFLSFRGEDTRDNFTSHLFAALSRKKVKTFIDDELKRGHEISPALLAAIEGANISVVIFSKDYASSKWCLDELVKILECHKMNGQKVLPVFYHVDPSDVRKQTGRVGDAFVVHEKQFREMPEKVQKWRAVLTEASNLSGWDSKKIRPEAKLVDEIVKDILKKLNYFSVSSDFEGLIGLDARIERIKSLLCIGLPNIQIMGIWGMGGIGKTTIAGVLFNQISRKFESKCFMANVREESEKGGGLVHLRDRLLSQILDESIRIETPYIPHYIRERLQCMKVFIVLDDVNKFRQLEYLAGGLDRFGLGSRIIVTSRDKQVLEKYGVDHIYEVEELNNIEALELFCKYAFRQNHHPQDLMVISGRVVDYARGNPLAIKVLASFFHRKSKLDWEIALQNLKQISGPEILAVLKISYDELNWEAKNLFLDIACFFKGEDINFVTLILDNHYSVHYGLSVLVDKSLVRISRNKLEMHDLLQDMGREIVSQESEKEPGKRSRLWYHEDIYHVLKKNKGTDTIEGIFLDLSKIRDINLNPQAFANMPNLRFLKFYMPKLFGISDMVCKLHLPQGLQYLSDELRYLHWHGYPLKMLPSNFTPENLIELNLLYSRIEQLWKGKKEAFNLISINLYHSQYLTRIPDPFEAPNLERINLSNCTTLPCIPQSVLNFSNLSILCLKGCKSLRCFPNNIHFRSPISLNFSYCVNFKEFPQISGNVRELYLRGTPIEYVPSSIDCLAKLEYLDLGHCTILESISTSICKLKSLLKLCLDNCSKLESFPEILEKMGCLEDIDLEGTAITELPSSIEYLGGLTTLNLTGCSKLDNLPENLGNLKSLKMLCANESAISQLPSSITNLNELQVVWCSGCRGLILPPSFSGLSYLTELDLSCCNLIEIPQDIGCLSLLRSLDLRKNNFEYLPASMKHLSKLKSLDLSCCNMLQSLPELPLQLKFLQAKDCKQLQSLPEIPSCLEMVDVCKLETLYELPQSFLEFGTEFMFTNCLNLNKSACNKLTDSQLRVQQMATASLRLCYEKKFRTPHGISICLPGSETPDWFSYQSSGSLLTIQLQQHSCNRRFIGFAYCAVIGSEEVNDGAGYHFGVKCSYDFETRTSCETKSDDRICYLSAATDNMDELIELDHILLGFVPCLDVSLPNGDHQTAASFKFSLYNASTNNPIGHKVKCCGVCPLYTNPNKTQSHIYAENAVTLNEEFYNDYEYHDKASTSESGRSDNKEMEPNPKRICRDMPLNNFNKSQV
ncbi:Disease resistance-like protein DSC1 [Citrus sinensis]|nr:Disease resistance-like protein DSC1 [Citrus sinensis]